MEVMDEDGIFFRCNECGAVLTKERVAPLILAMESWEVTCRLCGRLNQISGFSEVSAFVCRFCGEGMAV